jgi:hypothetical protein
VESEVKRLKEARFKFMGRKRNGKDCLVTSMKKKKKSKVKERGDGSEKVENKEELRGGGGHY